MRSVGQTQEKHGKGVELPLCEMGSPSECKGKTSQGIGERRASWKIPDLTLNKATLLSEDIFLY
jgi:hypothetical protein